MGTGNFGEYGEITITPALSSTAFDDLTSVFLSRPEYDGWNYFISSNDKIRIEYQGTKTCAAWQEEDTGLLKRLIDEFFSGRGYVLNGKIGAMMEDTLAVLIVENNVISFECYDATDLLELI